MDKQPLIDKLSTLKGETTQIMDVIITDMKNTVLYLERERDQMNAVPVEGRKEDESEYVGSFLSLLSRATANARVDKLVKRATRLGIVRSELDKLDAQ